MINVKAIVVLLLSFVLFFPLGVLADEYNMNNKTSATKDGTTNRYRGVEIVQTGMPGTFTFGTRYTGKLSTIETYFDYPFEANTTYTLTYNMNTEDFRNNFSAQYWWDCEFEMNATNQHVGSLTYVSYKKVKFSFKPSENTTCIRVLIGSSNQSSQAITGISNWRLDSITLYDPAYQTGSGGGQGSTPSSSPSPSSDPNQSIIDSQNNNTQDIINNQNDNTQDIIENNTENTDRIIDNQNELLGKKCANLFDKNTMLLASGAFLPYDITSTQIRYYGGPGPETLIIRLTPGKTYTISKKSGARFRAGYTNSDNPSLDTNGVITRISTSDNASSFTFTMPNDKNYFVANFYSPDQITDANIGFNAMLNSIMINEGSTALSYCEYNSYSSKVDDLRDGLDKLKDTMENDNIDDKTGFFTDFDFQDHGLSSIITLPLSTIQSLTNSSCVSLSIPIPFTNESVNLPCMSEVYQTYIPSIYNIWQIVSFGLISYFICLDIYKMVKGFKDPNEDKVEVLDL